MIKAILTGHSRGLGAALVEALLARGIRVLAISRSGRKDLETRYPELLLQIELDLSNTVGLADWLEAGGLDEFQSNAETALLVNNAGVLQPIAPVGRQSAGLIAKAINVNVAAPLMLADAFVRASSRASDRRILHISSGAARTAYAGWSVYCAAKAALDHHARAVAADAQAALSVVSLAPGVIDTGMQAEIRAVGEEQFPLRDRFVSMHEEGGLASPDAVAGRIADFMLDERFGSEPVADIRDL